MKLDLNLLNNGLDFLVEGLKPTTQYHSNNNSESIWKYSVLNVFSGIELILKHRLKQEHWSLIFEDVSNANESKLEQGDFISVNHRNVIKRLDGICNIKINDKPINDLRKLRNKFEHFEVKVEIHECKQVIAEAIKELLLFWDKNIAKMATEEQNKKFKWIKSMAYGFNTYADNVLKKHKKKIEGIKNSNSGILVHCRNCSNNSFIIYKDDKKECECLICEDTLTKEDYLVNFRELEFKELQRLNSVFSDPEIAQIIVETFKYDHNCLNCNKKSIVRYEPRKFLTKNSKSQSDYFFCIHCLYRETQEEIISRELEEELSELQRNNSPEEFLKILESRIKYLQGEE